MYSYFSKSKSAEIVLIEVLSKSKSVRSSLCACVVCLLVCFVALRPKSTAMVMAGRSVHLTTLFLGQA